MHNGVIMIKNVSRVVMHYNVCVIRDRAKFNYRGRYVFKYTAYEEVHVPV